MAEKQISDWERNFRRLVEEEHLEINLPDEIKDEDKEDLELLREQLLKRRLSKDLRIGIDDEEEMSDSSFDFAVQG